MKNLERAQCYIERAPAAISGDRGHDQTFRVVCALINFYRLPLSQVWELILEYNSRCQPLWSKAELIHKICDAYKKIGVFFSEADLSLQLVYCAPDKNCELIQIAAGPGSDERPDSSGFGLGTQAQLKQISDLRGVSLTTLERLQAAGTLVFGAWYGHEVFGTTDCSGRLLELRRLDGQLFPAAGKLSARKSHAVRGSNKHWPLGATEANDHLEIALVEGGMDFLACHDLCSLEPRADDYRTAVTAMLSANASICDDALSVFAGKHVRIYPHFDQSGAGYIGAWKWQQQLLAAGTQICDFFDFSRLQVFGVNIKDLNDFLVWRNSDSFSNDPELREILPGTSSAPSSFIANDINQMAAVINGTVRLPHHIRQHPDACCS